MVRSAHLGEVSTKRMTPLTQCRSVLTGREFSKHIDAQVFRGLLAGSQSPNWPLAWPVSCTPKLVETAFKAIPP